jgi:hypothetical protein
VLYIRFQFEKTTGFCSHYRPPFLTFNGKHDSLHTHTEFFRCSCQGEGSVGRSCQEDGDDGTAKDKNCGHVEEKTERRIIGQMAYFLFHPAYTMYYQGMLNKNKVEVKDMKKHEAYEKDMNIKLRKWGAKIDELKAEMDRADAKTRESIYSEMEKLQEMRRNAQERLESLKNSGKDSFKDLKTGVDNAVKDLGEAVGSALSHFK